MIALYKYHRIRFDPPHHEICEQSFSCRYEFLKSLDEWNKQLGYKYYSAYESEKLGTLT